MRIQNSSGTNLDVGFSSGYVDTSAIASHVGSGDGRVTIWYDQSGNGRDISQASTSAMPRVYIAGTAQNINGKLSAYFDGGDRLVSAAVSLHSGDCY